MKLGTIRWKGEGPSGRVNCDGKTVDGVLTRKNGTWFNVHFDLGYVSGPVLARYRLSILTVLIPDANERDAELELAEVARRNAMKYTFPGTASMRDKSGRLHALAQLTEAKDGYWLSLVAVPWGDENWLRNLPECRGRP